MLQAVLARGGPEGGFGPSLNQGLGSSAWMPHCVGRYLDKAAKYVHGIARGRAQVLLCAREALSTGWRPAMDLLR